jgi:hypothetical protein
MKQDDLKEQCMKLHIALSVVDSRNINTMDLFFFLIVWCCGKSSLKIRGAQIQGARSLG